MLRDAAARRERGNDSTRRGLLHRAGRIAWYRAVDYFGASRATACIGIVLLAVVLMVPLTAVYAGLGAIALVTGLCCAWPVSGSMAREHRRRQIALGEQRLLSTWGSCAEPGVEAPTRPEQGYRVIVPARAADDDEDIGITFSSDEYEWTGVTWKRLGPANQPESVHVDGDAATEVVASAWADFREAIATLNAAAWSRERERRANEAAEAADRQRRLDLRQANLSALDAADAAGRSTT
jgi:hypothetical protein